MNVRDLWWDALSYEGIRFPFSVKLLPPRNLLFIWQHYIRWLLNQSCDVLNAKEPLPYGTMSTIQTMISFAVSLPPPIFILWVLHSFSRTGLMKKLQWRLPLLRRLVNLIGMAWDPIWCVSRYGLIIVVALKRVHYLVYSDLL